MIVVADASVLVGELLRRRGRALLTHPALRVVIAEDQWDEAEHELSRRLEILAVKGILTAAQRHVLQRSVRRLIDSRALEIAHDGRLAGDRAAASPARCARLANRRAGDRPRRCHSDRGPRLPRLRLSDMDVETLTHELESQES